MSPNFSAWIRICLTILTLFVANTAHSETRSVDLGNDVQISYEVKGTGKPLIFLPGWTLSSEVFRYQIEHFSKRYRVIAIDPRGQGKSSRTTDGNTYKQHGADLARIVQHLGLSRFSLVSWSFGCLGAYSYIRQAGTESLDAFVCIDQPPRPLGEPGQWAEASLADEGKFFNAMNYDRDAWTVSFAQSMVGRKLTATELSWLTKMSLQTPTYVAILLAVDGDFSDYSEEAKQVSRSTRTLHVVSSAASKPASAWLKANAPDAEIAVLGNHMMFWEDPKKFNRILEQFLDRPK